MIQDEEQVKKKQQQLYMSAYNKVYSKQPKKIAYRKEYDKRPAVKALRKVYMREYMRNYMIKRRARNVNKDQVLGI